MQTLVIKLSVPLVKVKLYGSGIGIVVEMDKAARSFTGGRAGTLPATQAGVSTWAGGGPPSPSGDTASEPGEGWAGSGKALGGLRHSGLGPLQPGCVERPPPANVMSPVGTPSPDPTGHLKGSVAGRGCLLPHRGLGERDLGGHWVPRVSSPRGQAGHAQRV